MTVSPFDSQMFSRLLSDAGTAAAFSDGVCLRAVLSVESALAAAAAKEGVLSQDHADDIINACQYMEVGPSLLAESTAATGTPVPALLTLLAAAVKGEASQHVHLGASPRDLVNTGFVLRLRAILDGFEARLSKLDRTLGAVSSSAQAAMATHAEALNDLRPQLMVLSFDGDEETDTVLGDKRDAIVSSLAMTLGLATPDAASSHEGRSGKLASWMASLAVGLSAVGHALLDADADDTSSRVAADALIGLTAFVVAQSQGLDAVSDFLADRDAARTTVEAAILPAMLVATGAALNHALEGVSALQD